MQATHADTRHPHSSRSRAVAPRLLVLAAPLAAVALLAGCGGSSSNGSPSGGSGSSGGGSGTVKAASISGFGQALVTSSGASVYLLSIDGPNQSKCTGACTRTWIPVSAAGSATAGSGANSSLVATFKRPDGKIQVSYNKHPLYTHTGTGATSGQGVAANGGIWYLVSPQGDPIKKSASGGGY